MRGGNGILRQLSAYIEVVYRRADTHLEPAAAQGEDLRLGQHHMVILLVQRLLIRQFTIGGTPIAPGWRIMVFVR